MNTEISRPDKKLVKDNRIPSRSVRESPVAGPVGSSGGRMKGCLLFLALTAAVPVFAQQDIKLPSFKISSGAPLLAHSGSSGAVVGQGGNYTVAMPDGGVLWLLNNVWMGESRGDGQHAVWGLVEGAVALSRSTDPYSQRGDLAYVSEENGWPLSLLSSDLREYSQARKFRPRAGIYAGGRYYAFYSVLNNYGPGFYDFFRVGQGVAWAEKPGGPYQKLRSGDWYSLWSDIEPAFGSAALTDDDGWVYIYGRVMNAPGEYGAALARVRPENLAVKEKYSYYSVETASGAWTEDVFEASTVLENMPEEFSVSYNDFLKSYLVVYSGPESGEVYARTAAYPWGPWGGAERLLACKKEDYCEGAKEQAVFSSGDGRTIFLTLEKKNAPYLYELTFK